MLGASIKVYAGWRSRSLRSAAKASKRTPPATASRLRSATASTRFIRTGNGGAVPRRNTFNLLGDTATTSARARRRDLQSRLDLGRYDPPMARISGHSTPISRHRDGLRSGGVVTSRATAYRSATTQKPHCDSRTSHDVYYTSGSSASTPVNSCGAHSRPIAERLPTSGAYADHLQFRYDGRFRRQRHRSPPQCGRAIRARCIATPRYARIGQGDVLQIERPAMADREPAAAAGGRGGDITSPSASTPTIRQRSRRQRQQPQSRRRFQHGVQQYLHDGVPGRRQRRTRQCHGLGADRLAALQHHHGNQGTVDLTCGDATIGNGDDYILATGDGGTPGGQQSGLNVLDPAQGGAGGNINVLLGTAETQGNIVI